METKKLSVNTICVRGGYTPKNGEPIELHLTR
nr:MAG TPA: O-acetylhomoserine aminocarboxypropyltransferase [Bacteriophage sp.]DAO38549.1 MAG TPA: O-acetylhomoserine aminocarboxypropyltransferase [Caudoviricetes sp.]